MTTTAPVAKTTSKEIAAPIPQNIVTPHIGRDDFVAAKILPIHYQSEKAQGRGAQKLAEPGEFRDTIENKKFGDTETPFEFIPLHMHTFWTEHDMTGGGQGKYMGQYPVTAANEALPREETKDGKKIKRVKVWEAYALIPEEIKAGSAFPYVLSFRITSSRAGRTLLTQMYVRNASAGKLPYANVCELSLAEASNDNGKFFVQNVKPKRSATVEELAAAEHWYGLVARGEVAKDDSDLAAGDGEEQMKTVNSNQF